MQRKHLAAVLALLAVASVAYHLFRGWGLITLHATNEPLQKVLHQIEKQAGVLIRSNIDGATKITLQLDRAPIGEAMESLAAITEGRWRLTYLVGDSSAVTSAMGSIGSEKKLEGWKTFFYPLPPSFETDEAKTADPRSDIWNVQPPAEHKLQSYLEAAARSVSAAFITPENWNPDVPASPGSGPVSKTLPRLAASVHGKAQELILLQNNRRDNADRDRGGERGGSSRSFGEFNREAMEQRVLAEIQKMPPAEQAAAREELEQTKTFFTGLRELPAEERRAKMEEFFERPEVQERWDKREAERNSRRTPEQRVAKAQQYRERKQQALSASKK